MLHLTVMKRHDGVGEHTGGAELQLTEMLVAGRSCVVPVPGAGCLGVVPVPVPVFP